jgi:cholesterol oxidase
MTKGIEFTRRQILGIGGALTAGLALPRCAPSSSAPVRRPNGEPLPAVVIGSGFGGAVAALRLAQAGIATVVLERGRRWPIGEPYNTFTTWNNGTDWRSTWLGTDDWIQGGASVDRGPGLIEFSQEDGLYVVAGAGVGGGSLVYNAVTLQPRREAFERAFDERVAYDDLVPFYAQARTMIGPSPIPEDILATSYYSSHRVFLEQAKNAGFVTSRPDIAVDWDIVRAELRSAARLKQGLALGPGEVPPSAIWGAHWYGINSGAKKSLDRSYLAAAEATGRVDIRPLHLVTAIEEQDRGLYRVAFDVLDDAGQVTASDALTCRSLFLAAGSMGTTRLLVRARDEGTLPRLDAEVGRTWGNNGDAYGYRFAYGVPTNVMRGGPSAVMAEDPEAGTALQTFPNFPIPGASLPAQSLFVFGMSVGGAGGSFEYLPNEVDAQTGRPGAVRLHWQDPRIGGASSVERFEQSHGRLNAAPGNEGAAAVLRAITGGDARQVLGATAMAAHPLGGAVIGTTRLPGVCDGYGRVRDHERLYVVDGALIPGSTGAVNPSLTIAALAERALQAILAADGLGG